MWNFYVKFDIIQYTSTDWGKLIRSNFEMSMWNTNTDIVKHIFLKEFESNRHISNRTILIAFWISEENTSCLKQGLAWGVGSSVASRMMDLKLCWAPVR